MTGDDSAAWDARWASVIAGLRSDRHEESLRSLNGMLEAWRIGPLRRRGARTALFAGCGIEQTAKAFAFAGFESVGLDFSPVAIAFARRHELSEAELRLFFQRSLSGDRSGGDFSSEYAAPGGSWRYEIGDFMDPTVEPGPFDYVSAIRSLQGQRAAEAERIVDALDARVAPGGCVHVIIQNGGDTCRRYRDLFSRRGYVLDDLSAPGKVACAGVASG